jgi:hypothetical protein
MVSKQSCSKISSKTAAFPSFLTFPSSERRSDFEALHEAGVGEAFADEFGREVLTEESVRWAAATLLSRAFSLDLDLDWDEVTFCSFFQQTRASLLSTCI